MSSHLIIVLIYISRAVFPILMVHHFLRTYYLLTGCKGHTRKYKPKVFHTARACEGCLENQGLEFPRTARAPS